MEEQLTTIAIPKYEAGEKNIYVYVLEASGGLLGFTKMVASETVDAAEIRAKQLAVAELAHRSNNKALIGKITNKIPN